ncbi:hypothetical protein GCM10022223_43160 [Kineosporia mesophila]|uniref:Uncharacterized protein n=1 Tax=Kineosporia mesophila TaxID=566012 RepID=A0ABP6ZY22_9ACTN|nr:hypothetical protein [Kineosporia mesophila]MCD5353247.1 hypothetical protein [Kineosporia mesophila]
MATPEHALMTALDIVDFSGRDRPSGKRPMDDHQDLQQGLLQTFREACERADLRPIQSDIADRGDGLHVLFADPLEPARLVADLPRELLTALEPFNRRREPSSRLRVRMAVHEGYVRREPFPWQGDAIIKLVRMLNCAAASGQIRSHPHQVLTVTISDSVYQATVEERVRGLQPDQFEPISVQHDDRSTPFPAWIRLAPKASGVSGAADPDAVATPETVEKAETPEARVSNNNSGTTSMGDGSPAFGQVTGKVSFGGGS